MYYTPGNYADDVPRLIFIRPIPVNLFSDRVRAERLLPPLAPFSSLLARQVQRLIPGNIRFGFSPRR